MGTGTIAVIAIVIVAVLPVATASAARLIRRRELRQRFGAEYERLVDDRQSRRQAESELAMRERYVGDLGIRPLNPAVADGYAAQWAAVQERFLDEPTAATAQAQDLVVAVLRDCGYPTTHREQVISDLSVDHVSMLDHLRAAYDVSELAAAGRASTQQMLQALIHYRALFTELLGQSPAGASAPAASLAHPDDEFLSRRL